MPRKQRAAWARRVLVDDLPGLAPLPPLFSKTSEAQVLRGVLDICAVHPVLAWHARQNVGAVPFKGDDGKTRWVKFGQKGMSDVIGMTVTGKFIAIEVKAPGGRLTPEQERFLTVVAAGGGHAICVDDPAQALSFLNSIA